MNEQTKIVEMCRCGHFKSDHSKGHLGIAEGHGPCNKCDCRKFTWKASTQYKETNMPNDSVARIKFSIKRINGSVKKGVVLNKRLALSEDGKDLKFK